MKRHFETEHLKLSERLHDRGLTRGQSDQVAAQVQAHSINEAIELDVKISQQLVLRDFIMLPQVLRPMSSLWLGRHIWSDRSTFMNRSVIDIGTGTGLQGIVSANCGAKSVVLSDIAPASVYNASINVERQGVGDRCVVVQSDLFSEITHRADIIVFAQPYFAAEPLPDIPVTLGMLDTGSLVSRFLQDARDMLTATGMVVMCFMDFAGHVNDPAIQGPKHGYAVREVARSELTQGLQQGVFHVYELAPTEADHPQKN